MNIDRNNYEEYFILYMDNELSAQDRLLVEQFAVVHPDLGAELELLMGTRLSVDETIIFSDKQSLLRTDSTAGINAANFEEWCLLYTDNELSDTDRRNVEKFAASSPVYQEQLNSFARTISTPEPVLYMDKASLYRKEEKQRPVVYFTIRRIAIAASFVLAVSTTALLLSKNSKESSSEAGVAATTPTVDRPATKGTTSSQANAPVVNTDTDQQLAATTPVEVANPLRGAETPSTNGTETPVNKTNNLSLPTHNPNVVNESQNSSLAKLETPDNGALTNPKEFNQPIAVTVDNARPLQSGYAPATEFDQPETAAYTEVSEPGRKNKLRGFFRKVTRTFEKATNIQATDDEDRLLVGSLAIKL